MSTEKKEALQERFDLAMERIGQIREEKNLDLSYQDYFKRTAEFIQKIQGIIEREGKKSCSLEELKRVNRDLYQDICPNAYEESYANPSYSVEHMGEEFGRLFSMLYAQMYGMIGYAYESKLENVTIYAELFVEIYNLMEQRALFEQVKDAIYWFYSDYSDLFARQKVEDLLLDQNQFYRDIIESCKEDFSYLYQYGLFITDNELNMAKYLNGLSQEKLEQIARIVVEGYCRGFENTKRDLSKKTHMDIRYAVGLEPIIKASLPMFEALGLTPVFCRMGISSTPANRQFLYDHRYDNAVYMDRQYKERYLQVLKVAFEENKKAAATYAGPIVLETFGEIPFQPKSNANAYQLAEKQQKLFVEMSREQQMLRNDYIHEEETSFSIIAFPVPEIGDDFEAVFEETMKVNMLDYKKYQAIQQTIIDVLDSGSCVKIEGKGANRTDLTVALWPLKNPERETDFENCLADVNIPLGEVFTSPKLNGTNGVLHVTKVFLKGLEYQDLELHFQNGMITDYTCANFDSKEENQAFIRENLFYQRETLPMGEFAIGTNTTAYAMGQKFHIAERLPILIAEKTGPHFAIGDTCYSNSEEVVVYNPDGKEIVARENECSLLRHTEPEKAYFSCHTDITIPYHELGAIYSVQEDGSRISVILDSRFVLPGTEELNEPLEELQMEK